MKYFPYIFLTIFLVLIANADRQYKVATKRFSDKPIISRKIGSNFYSNLYAGIYTFKNEYGLIVGTWNDTGYYLVNSKLFYFQNGTISALPTLNNMTLAFPKDTTNYNSGGNNFDSVSFFNGFYYLLYDETDSNEYPVLAWAKTDNPFSNNWTRLGHIFPDSAKINTFKSSFLWGTKENALPMHYLFWDDTSAIYYETSVDGITWTSTSTPLLYPRPYHFDSDSIYVGTIPLSLKTGDFLFLYSAVNSDDDRTRTGWTILDAVNPTIVIQRGNESIMSPKLDWEQDIYLTSIIPDPYGCPSDVGDIIGTDFVSNAECFIGVYGIYEIGAVRVVSSWIDNSSSSTTPSSDTCADVDSTCPSMASQCLLSAYQPIMCKYCQRNIVGSLLGYV
uniref:Uncharacterized protein n=1 Tax=Panagrolaimus davidi TaxID=227884 RepID=A0A914QSH0_9BILA